MRKDRYRSRCHWGALVHVSILGGGSEEYPSKKQSQIAILWESDYRNAHFHILVKRLLVSCFDAVVLHSSTIACVFCADTVDAFSVHAQVLCSYEHVIGSEKELIRFFPTAIILGNFWSLTAGISMTIATRCA